MNMIQHWQCPQSIFLLIALMILMILIVDGKIWRQLRPYEVERHLLGDVDTFCASRRTLRLRLLFCYIIEVAIIFLLILFLPDTYLLIKSLLIILCMGGLSYAQWILSERLLRKYGFKRETISKNIDDMMTPPKGGKYAFYPFLLPASLALMVIAAMQPQGKDQTSRLRRAPLSVTVAFDLSRSMQATDYSPSRLDAARDEMLLLLQADRGDEIGLVFFTADAIVLSPQTTDLSILATMLKTIRPDDMPNRGTDIDQALRAAMTTFEDRIDKDYDDSSGRARRILLVTDGENHTGNIQNTIQTLKERHIHVDIIAVGTDDGAEIPDAKGNPLTHDGQIVVSRLNTDLLETISTQTDGLFLRLALPNQATKTLLSHWDTLRVDLTDQSTVAASYRKPLYPYFLYPAYILLLLFFLVPLLNAFKTSAVYLHYREKFLGKDN